jgi:hypothetical protein
MEKDSLEMNKNDRCKTFDCNSIKEDGKEFCPECERINAKLIKVWKEKTKEYKLDEDFLSMRKRKGRS